MKLINLGQKDLLKTASNLAQTYRKTPLIVGLSGPLGAGKTTFVKEFVKILGVKSAKSPSFVITHQYKTKYFTVYHLDFYRLTRESELGPLGINEILSGENMVLMEWVDKFPRLKKRCDILINININSLGGRDVEIINNKN